MDKQKDEKPPLLDSWSTIYWLLILFLAVQIGIFYWIESYFS